MNERAIEGQFGRASLACLLNFIGGWLHVGALCLVAFTLFLMWCGVREGLNLFAVLAGLVGIGHWLTSGTGLGFLVSGPRAKGAMGLSIATAGTGGFHLMLLIVIATSRYYGGFGSVGTSRTAELHWEAFVTQAGAIPLLLFLVIGYSDFFERLSDGSVLPVLACLFEIGRMILLLLTLRAHAQRSRFTRGFYLYARRRRVLDRRGFHDRSRNSFRRSCAPRKACQSCPRWRPRIPFGDLLPIHHRRPSRPCRFGRGYDAHHQVSEIEDRLPAMSQIYRHNRQEWTNQSGHYRLSGFYAFQEPGILSD